MLEYIGSIDYIFVSNKAKGRISKRVFQEKKARQIFRKTNSSYTLIPTRTCTHQGVINVRFSENLACFDFLKHPFWDSLFFLITDYICCSFINSLDIALLPNKVTNFRQFWNIRDGGWTIDEMHDFNVLMEITIFLYALLGPNVSIISWILLQSGLESLLNLLFVRHETYEA